MTIRRKTVGAFEPIDFPQFGLEAVRAKIDTGAYTGALHCTVIAEEEGETGSILRFSPFDHPEVSIETADFAIRYVRSSNGGRQKRYFIQTDIMIQGRGYPITLSLADRSEMKWPVLIGRRFLRQYNFLVDVRRANRV